MKCWFYTQMNEEEYPVGLVNQYFKDAGHKVPWGNMKEMKENV